jgi:hypothetical protein
MEVPMQTVCANPQCGHPLKDHADTSVLTLKQIKQEVHVCFFVQRDDTTFTVCGCGDFILPTPQGVPLPDEPDEPIHHHRLEPDIDLVLWASGKVTWDPM